MWWLRRDESWLQCLITGMKFLRQKILTFNKNFKCCVVLNSKIYACIHSMIEQDMYQHHSIEDSYKHLSVYWQSWLRCLESSMHTNQPMAIKGADISNIRKVRYIVCVCVFLYTTNSAVSAHFPCTLSWQICYWDLWRLKIKLLNRLGICTSVHTHARYVQYRVKRSVDAFTLVSVDNLDFVHSHARVYCGKQQSSWHGTTVQVVQLQPTRLVDTCSPSRLTCRDYYKQWNLYTTWTT